jgi:hypothetical protein
VQLAQRKEELHVESMRDMDFWPHHDWVWNGTLSQNGTRKSCNHVKVNSHMARRLPNICCVRMSQGLMVKRSKRGSGAQNTSREKLTQVARLWIRFSLKWRACKLIEILLIPYSKICMVTIAFVHIEITSHIRHP